MKDSTLRELAVLAAGSKAADEWTKEFWQAVSRGEKGEAHGTPLDYIVAAHPQAILSLLDRIEKLRTALRRALDSDASMGWGDIETLDEALAGDDKAQGA